MQPVGSRALRATALGVVAILLTYSGGFVFSGLQNASPLATVFVVVVAAVLLIEMPRTQRRAHWLVGLAIGAGVGFAAVPGGSFISLLLVVLIAYGFAATRSLAFLSGGLIGLSSTWLGLIIRGQLECERLGDPHRTCTAFTVGLPFLAVIAAVGAYGVVAGLFALRQRESDGPSH